MSDDTEPNEPLLSDEEMAEVREAYRKACRSASMTRVDAYDRGESWTIHPADVDVAHMFDIHPLGGTSIGLLVSRATSTWVLSSGASGIPDYTPDVELHSFAYALGAGVKGDVLVMTAAADAPSEDEDDEGTLVGYGTTITPTAARAWADALTRMADEAEANAETFATKVQTNVAFRLAEVMREAGVSYDPEDLADVGGAIAEAVAGNGDLVAMTGTGQPIIIRKMTDEVADRLAAGEDVSDIFEGDE